MFRQFDSNYNSEKNLKAIAKNLLTAAIYTMGLLIGVGVLVGIVLLGIIGAWALIVPLCAIVLGVSIPIPMVIHARYLWGFAEIVGNTTRMANNNGNKTTVEEEINDLPEL